MSIFFSVIVTLFVRNVVAMYILVHAGENILSVHGHIAYLTANSNWKAFLKYE